MIKDPALLREFEDSPIRNRPADYCQNLRIVEWLVEEARLLGVWPLRDPLEGIDVDIRVARAIHVHSLAAWGEGRGYGSAKDTKKTKTRHDEQKGAREGTVTPPE